MAAFLASDDNFRIYRRFGYLQARLLLEKQDELRQLEEELAEMDKCPLGLRQTRDLAEQDAVPRRELMTRIENTFNAYCMEILLFFLLLSPGS